MDISKAQVLRQVAAGYRSSAAKEADDDRARLLLKIAEQLETDAVKLDAEEAS